MTDRPQLTGMRLSELAVCPRRCALRGLGAIPAPPSDEQTRYFARGQMYGRYVLEQFKAKYGPDDVEAERAIRWPLGTGHADIYVRSEKLIVEVVSSTGGNIDHKITQVRYYLLHDPEAEHAAVYVVNPSDLSGEEMFPVFLHDTDRETLGRQIAAVQAAVDGVAGLPECAYATPSACRHAWCPFTEQAWQDYEPPDPVDLSDSPAIVALVADYYRADQDYKEAEGLREHRWQAREDARAALAEALPAGTEIKAGPFAVKRTLVRGRETFALGKARKAGAWLPGDEERFGPFISIGDGHSRIYLKRVSDEPVPDANFGEVPF